MKNKPHPHAVPVAAALVAAGTLVLIVGTSASSEQDRADDPPYPAIARNDSIPEESTRAKKVSKAQLAKIHGKIQFVDSFPDYKVKVVDSFADLHVKKVNAFPDKPGQWKIVDSFPDYKIQIVNSFPDFKVKYVDAFPGVQ